MDFKTPETTTATTEPKIDYNVSIKRAAAIDEKTIMFDMIVNGVTIYGAAVKKNKDGGMFVSLPSRKGKDGKYYNIAYFPMNDEKQQEIINKVLSLN